MRTIKDELIEANKFKDVVKLLNAVIAEECGNYPVSLFIKDEKPIISVEGAEVRTQAKILLDAIQSDINIIELGKININDFYIYIKNREMDLGHNISNHLCHRITDDLNNGRLTKLRTIKVISNMLDCANVADMRDDLETYEWNIPKGWYRYFGDN